MTCTVLIKLGSEPWKVLRVMGHCITPARQSYTLANWSKCLKTVFQTMLQLQTGKTALYFVSATVAAVYPS